MNRVLSLPHTPMFPGLLDKLQTGRHRTVVTEKGMVRFEEALGTVEMKFSTREHRLSPGTDVYVWWKAGGFVCSPAAEIEREERATQQVNERVTMARAHLAEARAERRARLAANVDIVLEDAPVSEPMPFG